MLMRKCVHLLVWPLVSLLPMQITVRCTVLLNLSVMIPLVYLVGMLNAPRQAQPFVGQQVLVFPLGVLGAWLVLCRVLRGRAMGTMGALFVRVVVNGLSGAWQD